MLASTPHGTADQLAPPPNDSGESAPLSLFMHTNRAVRPGAKRLGFELHTGWWADSHDVAKLRKTLPKRNFPYHWQVTLHQSFKVNWLLGAARDAPEPWVLADTDTIFQQCDAAEVRRRFERLRAPLVVGAEKKWWPRRDYTRNPYPATWTGLRYPNSGLLIGTRKGFEQLQPAYAAMPEFPCCPAVYNHSHSKWCLVEDQHCLQGALQNRQVDYALDVNATLFLNMFDVAVDKDIEQLEDGRYMYVPTGTVPCVLHFNGKSKDFLLKPLSMRASPSAWVVQASVKLNASSCSHRACRGACPGGREAATRPRCAPLGSTHTVDAPSDTTRWRTIKAHTSSRAHRHARNDEV